MNKKKSFAVHATVWNNELKIIWKTPHIYKIYFLQHKNGFIKKETVI